ncbi:MAG: HAMP domain-containing sensor histidine kinase [Gemmatimonas sp.]
MPLALPSSTPPSPGSSEGPNALALTERHRWSLAHRLALLIFALLAVVLVAFGAAAYHGVRDSALEGTASRLESVAWELASLTSRGVSARKATLSRIAETELVRRALVASPGEVDAIAVGRALEPAPPSARVAGRQPAPGDSTLLARELWTPLGERRYRSAAVTARDSAVLALVRASAAAGDTALRSPFFDAGGETRYWTVVPVHEDSMATARSAASVQVDVQQSARPEIEEDKPRVVGVFAELRRVVGSPATERTIRRLTGEDMHVYFTSRGSSEWSSAAGVPVPAPMLLPASDDTTTTRVTNAPGGPLLVVQAGVEGTPLVIVAAQSEEAMLSRARKLLRRMIVIGLVLLALGTVAAWMLSYRETRPLVTLRDAAEDIAQGDYSRRVDVHGGLEVAALARTFNDMAARIGGVTAELAQQNAALQRANEAKARFLAVMSHELRTPLNAIGGYADLMALGIYGPTTPEQNENLARIGRGKDQLLHLVSDILHYSRLDAGHLTLRREKVSLQEQFASVAETLAEQSANAEVTLVVESGRTAVCADPVRLQQVLLNLVTNAIRFTNRGGRVSLCAETLGEITAIHVRDNGIGIPAEQLESIFLPFMQVDNSLTRRVGGTGLGLSIVRDLAVAMRGSVSVESVVGHGSTFTVLMETAEVKDDLALSVPGEAAVPSRSGTALV